MAARAKSTSTFAVVEEDEDDDDDDAVGEADDEDSEGEGVESYTMPLLVASALWTARVCDGSSCGTAARFCAFPSKLTRAFSAAQLRSASLKRPSRVEASRLRL